MAEGGCQRAGGEGSQRADEAAGQRRVCRSITAAGPAALFGLIPQALQRKAEVKPAVLGQAGGPSPDPGLEHLCLRPARAFCARTCFTQRATRAQFRRRNATLDSSDSAFSGSKLLCVT